MLLFGAAAMLACTSLVLMQAIAGVASSNISPKDSSRQRSSSTLIRNSNVIPNECCLFTRQLCSAVLKPRNCMSSADSGGRLAA